MKLILYSLFVISIFSCQINNNQTISKDYLKLALDTVNIHTNNKENFDSINSARLSIANTLLDSAIKNDLNNISAYFWKSSFQLQQKDYYSSLLTATDGIDNYIGKQNDILTNLYVQRAILNLHLNKVDKDNDLYKALNYYSEQIKNNNSNIGAILNKATVLCYMDRNEEAVVFLQSKNNSDFELEEFINDMKDFSYKNIFE